MSTAKGYLALASDINSIFGSRIEYDEITDKIIYWNINTPNIKDYIDLDNYNITLCGYIENILK